MAMSSNSVFHALPYPTIEDGSISFPQGEYNIVPKREAINKITLAHEIKGSPFFDKLIENGEAKFACLLSVPKTGYRKLEFSSANTKYQKIDWELSVTGEAPKLRPILLYVGEHNKKYTLTESDGVAKIWQGKEISIPKGARLARTSYLIASSDKKSLITFSEADPKDIDNGGFAVEETIKEDEEFYFTVKAAPDLCHFMNINEKNKSDHLVNSILAHVLSRCFEILQSDHREDWEQYPNLRILNQELNDKLGCSWGDQNFQPDKAATKLLPLTLPKAKEDNDDL